MSSLKWTSGPVELVQNRDGALELIKATPKSDAEYTFDDTALASLFANMKESKLNVRASALMLHGTDTYPDSGFPKSLEAAVVKQSTNGNEYNFQWDAAQLVQFKPKGYALRLKFHKPCLYVFSNDFTFASMKKATGGNKRAPLTFKRVNVDGEKPPATEGAPTKGPRRNAG